MDIRIDKLDKFQNHPFRVNERTLEELKESISQNGIQTPLIVREKGNGKYEIISGHTRKRASELLNLTEVPCIIRNCTDDEAIVQMVDSNIQRDEILPSERAFAYKMKYEALKRQGKRNDLTCGQVVHKSRDEISEEESGRQISRYIRLTELIPELLDLVDDKKIAFTPAVEISYLRKEEQLMLLDCIQCTEATPSVSQAMRLKKLSKEGLLDSIKIDEIMLEEKANQKEKYHIEYNRFMKYIPRDIATPRQVEEYLLKCAIICKQQGIMVDKMKIVRNEESNIKKSNTKSRER